jgi:hypothetical protein
MLWAALGCESELSLVATSLGGTFWESGTVIRELSVSAFASLYF